MSTRDGRQKQVALIFVIEDVGNNSRAWLCPPSVQVEEPPAAAADFSSTN